MKREYYHVCSEGLEKRMIFRNRREFIMGINYVALCHLKCNVRILCFCLMGNHFHFILSGSYQECWKFGNEYKRMCGMMMKRTQESDAGMKDVELQVKEITNMSYLEYAIAYVLRNPVVAGFRIMPHQYEWSSGDMYFRSSYIASGRRADSFSIKEVSRLLNSNIKIPGHYIIDESGIISPLNYIDYKAVEDIFKHPSRLLGLLSAKKETEFEIYMGVADNYTPDIEELKDSVRELIRAEFGVKAVSQLSMEQRVLLCGLMRRNFRASRKQIALITRLNMETINKVV